MLLLSLWAILLAIACTYNDDMNTLFRSGKKTDAGPDQNNAR